jgi:nucleoside-diphosphate-sugar epimerase
MSQKRYVITGGGGFVGKALGKALRSRGHEVISVSRGDYPELRSLGIETKSIDISSDPVNWREIFKDADGVFHTAAKVDMWGDYNAFFKTNVVGTRNLIQVCREFGIRYFVYTSSPSVIHDGSDLEGIDESYPYPKHFDACYPETKAAAEQEVLAANNGDTLRTVSLRPHLIWGPEDTNLVPTILERARAGKLTRIGSGQNLIDLTFIDDCVSAHILAMEALERDDSPAHGKIYFISQGEPVNMWGWIDQVLLRNGLPKVRKSISKGTALFIARAMERVSKVLSKVGINYTPLLTEFLVSEMATHHYFSIDAARRDLWYQPSCSIEEGLRRTFTSPSHPDPNPK